MATTVWLMRVILAQWVVIFYPGVIIFWLIVHNKIDNLRPFGKTRTLGRHFRVDDHRGPNSLLPVADFLSSLGTPHRRGSRSRNTRGHFFSPRCRYVCYGEEAHQPSNHDGLP